MAWQAVNKNLQNSLSTLTKHQRLTAWRSMLKKQLMTNNINGIHKEIKASGQKLQTITNFKYVRAIISDAGYRVKKISRIAQCATTMTRLSQYGTIGNITLRSKRRIKAVEMRCYRRLLHISCIDHITNEIVYTKIQAAIGPYKD